MLAGVASLQAWYEEATDDAIRLPPLVFIVEHDTDSGGDRYEYVAPLPGVAKEDVYRRLDRLIAEAGDVITVTTVGESWLLDSSKNGVDDGTMAAILSGKLSVEDSGSAISVARVSSFGVLEDGTHVVESLTATVENGALVTDWEFSSAGGDDGSKVQGRLAFKGLIPRPKRATMA